MDLIKRLLQDGYAVSLVASPHAAGAVLVYVTFGGSIVAQKSGSIKYLEDLINDVYVQVPEVDK
jgi:hypothetical protein